MNPGRNRLGLILVTPQNSVIEGGTAKVWVGKDTRSKATGTHEAPWYELTAYEKTHDRSPRTPARTIRHGDRAAGRGDLERGSEGRGRVPPLRRDRGAPGNKRGDPRPAGVQGD